VCHITVRVAIGEQECCGLFAFRELFIEHNEILRSTDAAAIGKRTSSSSVLSTSSGRVLREDRVRTARSYCCHRLANGGDS
jgi:hypothetical protein